MAGTRPPGGPANEIETELSLKRLKISLRLIVRSPCSWTARRSSPCQKYFQTDPKAVNPRKFLDRCLGFLSLRSAWRKILVAPLRQ